MPVNTIGITADGSMAPKPLQGITCLMPLPLMAPKPGYSTGDAIKAIQEVAEQLFAKGICL